MPGKIYSRIKGTPINLWQAMVEIDTDIDAEQVVIIERTSMVRLVYQRVAATGVIQLRVPIEYSTINNLIVGILDDDRVYGAKFLDGIQAQIIDGNVLTMQQ
ncbi:hypothetical protein [Shewanella mangrovisoli]|uniref:hypothetical protein n=1 Tax=Shewanella mangrovisoli TaxID=2864211 RepID=UPI0035B8CDA9